MKLRGMLESWVGLLGSTRREDDHLDVIVSALDSFYILECFFSTWESYMIVIMAITMQSFVLLSDAGIQVPTDYRVWLSTQIYKSRTKIEAFHFSMIIPVILSNTIGSICIKEYK
jgi:hypothetical protein